MTLAIRSLWPACGPACGRSATLRDDIVRRTHTQAGRFRVLGYTDRMADLMRVANLFVGKPGGLSSSECMAAGLPMVLVNPIPGQEERNADYLLEEGAAIRCNYETGSISVTATPTTRSITAVSMSAG